MKKVFALSQRKSRLWSFVIVLPWLLILCASIASIGLYLTSTYLPEVGRSSRVMNFSPGTGQGNEMWGLLEHYVLLPFCEEVTYRFLPFCALWYFYGRYLHRYPSFWTLCIVAVLLAIPFGLLHGNYANILVQGATSLVVAGALVVVSENGDHPFRGLLAATALHSLFNIVFVNRVLDLTRLPFLSS